MKKITSALLMVGIIAFNFGFISPKVAMAASLTAFSDTVSNLTASTAANHTIKFTTPTGIPASSTVVLTFSSGPNLSSIVFGDIDLQDDGVDVVLASSPTGSTWGVVPSGQVITFTNGSTAVAAGSVVTIKIGTNATGGTNQIVNGTAGTTTLTISGTFGDTGVLSMSIISNGVVAVTAEVLGSISFTVSNNSINFGTLTTSNGRWATPSTGSATLDTAFTLTAGTNAPTGYSVSVQGDTLKAGLNSITALAANTASTPGIEQFGIALTAAGGSGTVTAPYTVPATGYVYQGTATTPSQVASHTGPSATTTYTVNYLANIEALTEAGSYSTAHTYVATGNF